jgi:hypothetical protein
MAPQIPRLALAFGALIVGFLAYRSQVVPASFGETGFYRADFVRELQTVPNIHAGRDACMTCHEDLAKTTTHVTKGVACESCHGPSKEHSEDFEKYRPARLGAAVACARCHEQIAGRPSGFPQVVAKEHSAGQVCRTCHTVHESRGAQP